MGFISTFNKIIIKAIAENLTPTHVATVDENGLITKTPIELIGGGGTVDTSVNTFIGGIGATTTTHEALAILLDVSPNDITNFSITNNDIECNISVNYAVPTNCFVSNNEITSYWDFNGKVTALGDKSFGSNITEEIGTPNLTHAYFPECTSIGDYCFAKGGIKKELIYLPKCIAIGSSVVNKYAFWYGTFNNCRLYVDPYLQTCNSGGVEGDIAYNLAFAPYAFKSVSYVANYTVPNAINDLSATYIGGTYITINWSTPSAVNNIDYYQVYVNDVLFIEVSGLELVMVGLTELTDYTIKIKAVDEFYNISEFSNIIVVNTDNSIPYEFTNTISRWKLDNTVLDSVGSNNGVATDITYATGKVGECAVFNGTSSIVKFTGFNTGFNAVDFSVSQLFKTTDTSFRLLQNRGQGAGGTVAGWQISAGNSSDWGSIAIDDGLGNIILMDNIVNNEIDNEWHSLIMTWDTSSGTCSVYIDGIFKGFKTDANLINANLNGLDVCLGGSNTNGQLFNGSADEAIIFNKKLTDAEAQLLAKIQLQGVNITTN